MFRERIAALLLSWAALVALPGAARSAEPFYAAKTINVIVPYAPGGYYDIGARLVARHFGRHIPGQPTIVVQNQPGVGGISLANRYATGSRNDGLEIGVFQRALPQYALVGFQNANFDPLKLNWIGSLSGYENDSYVLTINRDRGFETIESLRTASAPARLGAGRAGSANLLYSLIAKELFDLRVEIVRGYDGNASIFLAQQRGEVDGVFSDLSTLKTSNSDAWGKGSVRGLVQFGRKSRLTELANVPTARELVRDAVDLEFLDFAELPFFIAWPLAAPAGTPADRLQSLQEAFMAMCADPAFRAEANRLHIEVDAVSGAKVMELIAAAAKTSPALRQRFLKLVSQ